MEKLINDGWQFKEKGADAWTGVTLPHTVKTEPLNVCKNYQGLFLYQKEIVIASDMVGKTVQLIFDGVMTNCILSINGREIMRHYGGYLPFVVDISQYAVAPVTLTLSLEVDNRDDRNTPPGKSTNGLDFLYYGGIYRNVRLKVADKVYITHSVFSEHTRGGVQVVTERISDSSYRAFLTAHVQNGATMPCKRKLNFTVTDCGGAELFSHTAEISLAAGEGKTFDTSYTFNNIYQWSPDSPVLYNLLVKLEDNGELCDEYACRFGFRSAYTDDKAFYLNGAPLLLWGVNRHQQFPYLGIAAGDNAQRREARLLKEAGINCVRLSHYPQCEAFLDECSVLGIIVVECIPGWQYRGGKLWQRRLFQNGLDMVRRDRNYAACIIFELTPNETYWASIRGQRFFERLNKAVKAEAPGCITAGDTYGKRNPAKIALDLPYVVEEKLRHPPQKVYLVREYGDWKFGGNNSTSRVSRGDGDTAMQVQAWNFQMDYNLQRQSPKAGFLLWEGIDHNRGYFGDAPISKSGILDIFRLPKFSYYYIKSQKKPLSQSDAVLFPLSTRVNGTKKLVVYSNLRTVTLKVGDKVIAKGQCDCGADTFFDPHGKRLVQNNYWEKDIDHIKAGVKDCDEALHSIEHLFDGGNCSAMLYPPFTFNGLELDGVTQLELEGTDGIFTKTVKLVDYSAAERLSISVATMGLPLLCDDNDFVFVYVRALDGNGAVDCAFSSEVRLQVNGGKCIATHAINAEAGVASFLVTATEAKVTLSATADGLMGDTVTTEALSPC